MASATRPPASGRRSRRCTRTIRRREPSCRNEPSPGERRAADLQCRRRIEPSPALILSRSPAVSQDRISEYLAQFAQTRSLMLDQLRRIIVGQSEVIEQILAAIFTRGHCLLVGVPGLAKTLMV